jgi:hypothetical protein
MARPYRHGPSAVRVRGGMADNDLRARLVRGGASRAVLEPSLSLSGITDTLRPPAKPALSTPALTFTGRALACVWHVNTRGSKVPSAIHDSRQG